MENITPVPRFPHDSHRGRASGPGAGIRSRPAARPAGKRGPASRLQQQIDAIGQLPKAKQKFVVEMIDTVLAQHAL
jgi:hypothetical protein